MLKKIEAYDTLELSTKEYAHTLAMLNITDWTSANSAKTLLELINKDIKKIEDARKHLTKPYVDIKKWLDTKAKELKAPLDELKNDLKAKAIVYQKWVAEKLAEEKAYIAEAGKSAWDSDEIKEIVEIENRNLNYEYEQNRAKGTYTDYVIVSVDIRKVPEKYLEVKEGTIRSDLRKNIRIPGVKFKEEMKIK